MLLFLFLSGLDKNCIVDSLILRAIPPYMLWLTSNNFPLNLHRMEPGVVRPSLDHLIYELVRR